jgi:hypothetical protein
MWQAGAEMTSCCAVMYQLGFNSLLMWVVVFVPCGIGWVRWPAVAMPCGIGWGEVTLLWSAIWHSCGAHLSGACARVRLTC